MNTREMELQTIRGNYAKVMIDKETAVIDRACQSIEGGGLNTRQLDQLQRKIIEAQERRDSWTRMLADARTAYKIARDGSVL